MEYTLGILLAVAVTAKIADHVTTAKALKLGAYEKMPLARWMHKTFGKNLTTALYIILYVFAFLAGMAGYEYAALIILCGGAIGAAGGTGNNLAVIKRLERRD